MNFRKSAPWGLALLLMAPAGGYALQNDSSTSPANTTGPVAFWSGTGEGKDWAGVNDATLYNMAFEKDTTGRAFSFDGANSWMTVSSNQSLDIGAGDGFTIECWIKPSSFDIKVSGGPIIEWDSDNSDGLQLWSGGNIFANLKDTSGAAHTINVAGIVLSTNEFQNVALTYDRNSGFAMIYYNGAVIANKNFGDITPQTSYPASIGRRTAHMLGFGENYGGLIDSLAIYNRALSSSEIKKIYRQTRSKPASPPRKSPDHASWPAAFVTSPYSNEFAVMP